MSLNIERSTIPKRATDRHIFWSIILEKDCGGDIAIHQESDHIVMAKEDILAFLSALTALRGESIP